MVQHASARLARGVPVQNGRAHGPKHGLEPRPLVLDRLLRRRDVGPSSGRSRPAREGAKRPEWVSSRLIGSLARERDVVVALVTSTSTSRSSTVSSSVSWPRTDESSRIRRQRMRGNRRAGGTITAALCPTLTSSPHGWEPAATPQSVHRRGPAARSRPRTRGAIARSARARPARGFRPTKSRRARRRTPSG